MSLSTFICNNLESLHNFYYMSGDPPYCRSIYLSFYSCDVSIFNQIWNLELCESIVHCSELTKNNNELEAMIRCQMFLKISSSASHTLTEYFCFCRVLGIETDYALPAIVSNISEEIYCKIVFK